MYMSVCVFNTLRELVGLTGRMPSIVFIGSSSECSRKCKKINKN